MKDLMVMGINWSWFSCKMLVLLRRFCSFLISLLLRAMRSFGLSKISSRNVLPQSEVLQESDQWVTSEWDQGGDEWEPFTVQVVPHESPQDEPSVLPTEETKEVDLFSDMQPVFRKPTMIRVTKNEERQEHVDLNKFSVQDEAFTEDDGLGLWSDEVGGGWEDGVDQDEGDLVKNSREALRNKRAHEREQRRIQQERMRTQLKTGTHSLGTRMA